MPRVADGWLLLLGNRFIESKGTHTHMSRNSDFGTFGRYTELQLDEMTADQRKAYEFTVGQRGDVPGPYKIWLQNPKLIEVMVPLGAYYQGRSSLSKAEIDRHEPDKCSVVGGLLEL